MTRLSRHLDPLSLAAVALFAVFAAATPADSSAQPVAAVRNVTERHFGVSVNDPYRYFENKTDPDVVKWMKAQNDHARDTLTRIPGRQALLDSIVRYDASVSDRVTQVKRLPGEIYFMERRGANDNQFKLVMRQGLGGKEKLLIDPQALENRTRKPHAINWFSPSPDGSLVAFGMSKQGSEAAVMSILNTRGGRTLGAPITRADFGGVDWSPDGRAVVFNRLQAMGKGMAATQKYQNSQTYLLRIGSPPASARPVFGTAIKGLGHRAGGNPDSESDARRPLGDRHRVQRHAARARRFHRAAAQRACRETAVEARPGCGRRRDERGLL